MVPLRRRGAALRRTLLLLLPALPSSPRRRSPFFLGSARWGFRTKPVGRQLDGDGIHRQTRLQTTSKKKKYNMILYFYKKYVTPYFQNAIKLIIFIVTNQGPDSEAAHLPTPSYHRRHRRHTGL
jgi:hypothetical protein